MAHDIDPISHLLGIDAVNSGDVPSLDAVSDLDGFRPIPNRPDPAPLDWAPADAVPADNDGLF